MRTPAGILLAATLAAAASGCSFASVRRPPPDPRPDAPLECTQSRTAPALDTAGAVVTPLTGMVLWSLCAFTASMNTWASDPSGPTPAACTALAVGAVLGTTAYVGSAVYGYKTTGDCRRLAAERAAQPPPAP
jgi:hypothetical protein